MINICICDSNSNEVEELNKLIETYFVSKAYLYNILTFDDGESLVLYCQKNHGAVDLLFIDLNLPKMNGFEASKTIRRIDERVNIVINTKTQNYALKSFEVWPLYYNIKPMKFPILTKILDRFIFQEGFKENKLTIKKGKKYVSLSYNEIMYIESRNTTIVVHMNNYEELTTYGKLDDIEKLLSNKRFLRCHKSFLINMDYIKSADGFKFTTIFGDSISIKQREV